MAVSLAQQIAALPHTPGVYLFYDKAGRLLYVGKSASLRSRVQSYFRADFGVNNAAKQVMIPLIAEVRTRQTESEIEALILEASLIKKLKPRFNRLMRDDKSYRWVAITKELFPKVFITHEPRPANKPKKVSRTRPSGPERALFSASERVAFIGPFTEGLALKQALKALRHIFPFCTCRRPHKRACLNSQLGLCPGYCCLKHESWNIEHGTKYRENIKNLIKMLKGQKPALVRNLRRQMKVAADQRQYERASQLRDQIHALETFLSHRHVIRVGSPAAVLAPKRDSRTKLLGFNPLALSRVECYDISNTQGALATASMVVFSLGESVKSEYRKFRIKFTPGPDDFAMLQETIGRRLNHPEWPLPDLMVIDGGAGQRSAVAAVLKQRTINLPLFALAKQDEVLYTGNNSQPIPLSSLPEAWAHLFQRIRNEAHRFALQYHRHLRDTAVYRA